MDAEKLPRSDAYMNVNLVLWSSVKIAFSHVQVKSDELMRVGSHEMQYVKFQALNEQNEGMMSVSTMYNFSRNMVLHVGESKDN